MKSLSLLNHRRTQRDSLAPLVRHEGLSAIETGIVLLVIVVFITLGLANASKILGQSSVAEEATNIANLTTSARATRTGAGYGSDILADLVATNGVPSNMALSTDKTTLQNRWGGTVTFATVNSSADFTLTYNSVPTDECVQLVTTVKKGVLRSVGAGTTTTVNIIDIDVPAATTICDGTTTLIWSSAEI